MSLRPPIVVTVVLIALVSGCAPASQAESPSPTGQSTTDAVPTCPPATVEVSSADELHVALEEAAPGAVIGLADGVYHGSFTAREDGSADRPIYLCGGPGAILDGGGVDGGYVLHLDGVRYWRVLGFTVRNGKKGIMADRVERVVLGGLVVEGVGDEGIHLRRFSVDNLVVGNRISSTGLRKASLGEGIYVGTAQDNWCDISDCHPDRSDRNRIVGNTISKTTAEAVDIKEGTSGGAIADNHFDGSEMVKADSWVDVKGNDWLISGNVGTSSPKDGFQTHEILEGWGRANHFTRNTAEVDGPGAGFVFQPRLDNVLACDNVVSGAAAGLSNVSCTD